MNKKEMQVFLESKGIQVLRTEGTDFSAVFHVSKQHRELIQENIKQYEQESGLIMATSDNFGMNVVIMENDEE